VSGLSECCRGRGGGSLLLLCTARTRCATAAVMAPRDANGALPAAAAVAEVEEVEC
jgi:hypothetical protein